jgi:hypothetical protein
MTSKKAITVCGLGDCEQNMAEKAGATAQPAQLRSPLSLGISIPGAKGPQIRVGDEPKKVSEFRDVQLTISIPVGHLELDFKKSQQLGLAYFALLAPAGAVCGLFGHKAGNLESLDVEVIVARYVSKYSKKHATRRAARLD